MWTYTQLRGQILNNGEFIGTGHSGHGPGLNNPDMEDVAGVGPIPRGQWRIVRWDDQHGALGPIVAILEPIGHNAHNRSLLRIHGPSASHPLTDSDGCIVAEHDCRVEWRASGDMDLLVTA